VIERGRDLGLTLDPGKAFGVTGEGFRQHLDGDVSPELAVVRLIDLAHSARPDGGGDFVHAEPGADSQGPADYTRAGLFERPPLFDQAYALNRLFMPGGFTLRQLPPIRWPASSFFTKGTESTSEAFTVPP
jgi:hypothetical protein